MLELLVPKLRVHTVFCIPMEKLYAQGYRGVIIDLDNTLVGAKTAAAPTELIEWFIKVKKIGFQIMIVSNNYLARVSLFANPLRIHFLSKARKPLHRAFKKSMGMMDVTPEQTIVIGDQLLTDVLGGNRLGLYTILVLPIAIHEEGWMTRFNRRLERLALVQLRKRGLWLEEEEM